jgi:hypothetical protein
MGDMKLLPAPNVPVNTEAQRMINALNTCAPSESDLLTKQARLKRASVTKGAANNPAS